MTVKARPWTQSASGVAIPNRRGTLGGVARRRADVHARARRAQGADGHAQQRAVGGYLYGALEVVGLPADLDKRKGVVTGYRLVNSLRYNAATADATSIKAGAAKVAGKGKARALTLRGPQHGQHARAGQRHASSSRARSGPRTARSRPTRILPGKSVALALAVAATRCSAGQLHGHGHAHAGQAEDDGDEEDHGAPLSDRVARGGAARRAPHPGGGGARRPASRRRSSRAPA